MKHLGPEPRISPPRSGWLEIKAPTSVEYRQWVDCIFVMGKRIMNYEFFYEWQRDSMRLPPEVVR